MFGIDVFDVQKIRTQFPALNQKIDGAMPMFLDGPGGTQVPQSVIDAISKYLTSGNANLFGNAFFAVQNTHDVLDVARENARMFVNASNANEIVFGANMTTITAHMSRSIANEWRAGDEIIVTALDHYANVSFWQRLAEEKDVTCHMVRLNTDNCTLDYEHFERLLSDKTRLVAFTLAGNICGSVVDAKRIMASAKSVGALSYCDAVHYSPHFLPDVQDLGCDFLACSAYKFFGPHLGMVFGKSGHLERLKPYKVEPATKTVPDCWETGTKSFEALAGFNASIEYLCRLGGGSDGSAECSRDALLKTYEQIEKYEQALSQDFLERAARIKAIKIHGITDMDKISERTPTFAMTFAGRSVKDVSDALASHQISTGSGHFYAQGVTDALGFTGQGGVVRAGFLHYNTHEEITQFFEVLNKILV